jgi:hypothetical protein
VAGKRRARKRRALAAAPDSLGAPLARTLGALILDAEAANVAAASGAGTPSSLRPPFKLDGEAPFAGPGLFPDAAAPPPPGASLGLRFKLLGAPGAVDAAGSLGGWLAGGGGGGSHSPQRTRALLAPADCLGAGLAPVAGLPSPGRGLGLPAGPPAALTDAEGVAGLARFLNDTATDARARRGPRQFPQPGGLRDGLEAAAAGAPPAPRPPPAASGSTSTPPAKCSSPVPARALASSTTRASRCSDSAQNARSSASTSPADIATALRMGVAAP